MSHCEIDFGPSQYEEHNIKETVITICNRSLLTSKEKKWLLLFHVTIIIKSTIKCGNENINFILV